MVRKLIFFIYIFILFSFVYAGSNNAMFTHIEPQIVLRGEDARIEVMMNTANNGIYDVTLFYRELGEEIYQSERMEKQGFLYVSDISTKNVSAGQIQYYIAYEGPFGIIGSLPEESPHFNPFTLEVTAARNNTQYQDYEVVIISPNPDDIMPSDDVVIAASFLGAATQVDLTKTQLLIDGVNVTSMAEIEEGLVTLVPNVMPVGRHNVELKLFNSSGDLLANQEWSFRSTRSVSGYDQLNYRGSVFAENRTQNIANTSDSYSRIGTQITGNYSNLEFHGKLLFSSEESDEIQPVNRYAAQLRYNFSQSLFLYLKGGDFVPYYNPLAFQDKRVRGLQTGFRLGFFAFDFVTGQTNRGIDGRISIDSSFVNGTYEENIIALRPGFRFGESVEWNFNFVNAKEDENSIDIGGNVKESVSIGTDLKLNFDKSRVLFDANFQASVKNTDAGGPELEFEDLTEFDKDLADNNQAESAFNLVKNSNLLSPTAGLNVFPSLAMQFNLRLRYFQNYIKLTYLNIENEFASPGNPYLLKDISGFYASDNIRLLNNQIFLNLFYKGYQNNISEDKLATTNNELGATISYFPMADLPSLTLGFTNYARNNDVTAADTVGNSYAYFEDNTTQRLSLSSSYKVDFSNLTNTLLLNFSNYARDDAINPQNQSDFNMFTIGVRTRYKFPLSTNLSFSTSESNFGAEASKSTTEIQKINLGANYRLQNLIFDNNDLFRPFMNLSFQDVKYSSTSSSQRNTYSAGILYQSNTAGIFTLRYDQISQNENNDTIFNARYEYNF